MRTINFYSSKEEAKLVKLINSGQSIRKIAEKQCCNFNRSAMALEMKMRKLTAKMENPPKKKTKVGRPAGSKNKNQSTTEGGIVVPQGVSLDLNSKRVVLYENHVRIYF